MFCVTIVDLHNYDINICINSVIILATDTVPSVGRGTPQIWKVFVLTMFMFKDSTD